VAESPLQALERELDEEIGLALVDEPPHVWHQRGRRSRRGLRRCHQ
jgi:8-oxo-dGTP pyrophosphatase MutT (NUDIX family)